jgi:hypothetical protein
VGDVFIPKRLPVIEGRLRLWHIFEDAIGFQSEMRTFLPKHAK